jgi:hypothetical protein
MTCTQCKNGKIVLFTSVTDCEACKPGAPRVALEDEDYDDAWIRGNLRHHPPGTTQPAPGIYKVTKTHWDGSVTRDIWRVQDDGEVVEPGRQWHEVADYGKPIYDWTTATNLDSP